MRAIVCFSCTAYGLASAVSAQSAIDGGTLTEADTDQLETLQGVGDKTFSDISSGDADFTNAFDFGAATDVAGVITSLDDIMTGTGENFLIEDLFSDPSDFLQLDNK